MLVYVPFYKVIVIAVDMFESTIIDERHFPTKSEADEFANQYKCSGGGYWLSLLQCSNKVLANLCNIRSNKQYIHNKSTGEVQYKSVVGVRVPSIFHQSNKLKCSF